MKTTKALNAAKTEAREYQTGASGIPGASASSSPAQSCRRRGCTAA